MFKPTTAKSPREYIEMIDNSRKSDFKRLFDMICDILPNEKPYMVYSMIGWKKFHYKYASGREGDWPAIALASQKNYISVYVCAAENGQYIAEKYKSEFPKASIGKSCIRFKKTEDIDLNLLTRIIKEGVKAVDAGNFFA